jgi:hypothetical protein
VAGGEPWAVGGDGYVLVASPLTADGTDLPVRASWVPWLGSIIAERLGGEAGAVIEVSPAKPVARPAWARELEAPDGGVRTVSESRITAPERPGVYFWRRGTSRAGAVVVNADVSESDPARLSATDLGARFAGGAATVASDAERWIASVFAVSGRRTLDGWFLVAALVLLGAEAIATRALPERERTAA